MKRILMLVLLVSLLSFSNVLAQKKKTKKNKKVKGISISKVENQVLKEINYVRRNPKKYIKFLKKLKKGMRGKVLKLPNGERWQMTEGKSAINEAIRDLKRASRLKEVKYSNGLSEVANIQLKDLKKNINLKHRGKDGSTLATRLSRVGRVGNSAAENISYYSKDAQTIVLTMIIDDGVRNRGHRKNILSKKFTKIGIAHGKGKSKVSVCVLVFADRFTKGKKGGAVIVRE